MADETKELIASSEFDPSNFVRGIDSMTAALEKLSAQEDEIRATLRNVEAALKQNRTEYKNTTTDISNLDKSSKTYRDDLQRLTAQKKLLSVQQKELKTTMDAQKTTLNQVNTAANTYRGAVEKITLATKEAVKQGKGATFFDTASLSKQVGEINAASAKLQNAFKGKISTEELDKFEQELSETTDEFDKLSKIIVFTKSKMDTLDPNSEEFAELNRVVAAGDQVLENYGKVTENVDKKSVSLRTRLAALRTTLSDLEAAGKENTQEFENMAIEAGRLQDQMEDTQQRIKVLASDTKALDFGIQAIRGVASAFGVAEGAAALFGLKSEDVAKSLQRLNAIMLVLNGLQELQTILQKQSTVAVLGQKAALDTVTFAFKSFKNALISTGIGALVIAIGFLVKKFIELSAEMKEVGAREKILNDITKDAIKGYATEVTRLELVKRTLNDLSISQKRRIEVAKEYNKTAEEGNKIDLEQIDNIALINRAIDSQIAKIKERAFARAAEAIIGQRAEAVLLAQEEARLKNINLAVEATKAIPGTEPKNIIEQEIAARKQLQFLREQIEKDPGVIKAKQELEDALTVGARLITPESLTEPDLGKELAKKNIKEIENEFQRKKAELDQQLAEATRKEADDESKIRIEFAARLAREQLEIQKLFNEKKLTAPQVEILSAEAIEINTAQLDNALKDFRDKIEKFRRDIDNRLFELQLKAGLDSAELIREQFVRETEVLKIESGNEINQLIKDRDALIKAIEDQPALIPAVKTAQIEAIKQVYFQLLENIKEETVRKQEEIAAGIFEKLQEETRTIFANVQLVVSETATAEIQAATEQFTQGKINYEAYQKELTRIATEESNRRIATQLREAQQLLADVQRQIPTEQDPGRLEELRAQELELKNRIDALKREEAAAEGQEVKKDIDARNQRIQQVAQYAQAIGGIIQQVVGFWQQVNEAEQASLEKSIALQEKRVEAATKIAERGNSEYLRLEEDRLQELQLKQENAARRQIAINAVLQTSQALTAFISALAQGIALGGPIGGIAIAAAVIAAIASGYAIVQSLQPATPGFKEGTKYVEKGEHREGVDTIPARLTKGEAVLPVDINKEYRPVVHAIFDKKIPPEVINNFVNNYNKTKTEVYKKVEVFKKEKIEKISESDYYIKVVKSIQDSKIPIKTVTNFIENYAPAVKAISDKKIPAEAVNEFITNYNELKNSKEIINSFVNNYRVNNRVLPTVNYERMAEATQIMISYDGELLQATKEQSRKLDQNNELLQRVEHRLKNMGIEVNVDRNGLAISMMKAVEQYKIDRKA